MSRTLLFDLDGTLTDNYAGIAASICHALTRMDLPEPDANALRGCVGPPLRESFARLLPDAQSASIERAIAYYRERYGEIGWRENQVYAGIPALLSALHVAGHRLILCTSKPTVYARRIIAHFGLEAPLTRIYGTDLGGQFDDKARLLGHLMQQEGIVACDATMIGDRSHDMRAAHAHGVGAIGVLWGYGSRSELEAAGAEYVVATPAALGERLAATPQ